MKIKFTQILRICLLLFFSGISVAGLTQTQISGRVTNAKDNTPVAGVTVKLKSAKTSTKTNVDGYYSISATASSVLVFSSVGYELKEFVPVAGSAELNVKLVQTTTQLQDVVVVAYGTRKKTDLTGSVVSVGQKDFQKGVINSSEQLLQGKVAGLEVTTGGGAAGGGSKIRIRGGSSLNASNDPLVVIDGLPVDNNNLAGSPNLLGTINPNDIESISVLKDASATALYGSRATNGVILITTKKGASGKTQFNFNSKYSVSTVNNFIDVLTGDQVRTIINADAAATGNNSLKAQLGSANTNWQKIIYQKAIGVDNNLSASGTIKSFDGSFKLPFRASAGYLNQDGVLRTNNFQRLSGSLNLTPKLFTDHLLVNLSTKFTHTRSRFANEGAVGNAVSFDPTQPVYSNGKYHGFTEYLDAATGNPNVNSPRNPLGLLENRENYSDVDRFIGNVQLDYKLHFFPDLHILANVGVDDAKGLGSSRADSLSAEAYTNKGDYSVYKQQKSNRIIENSLLYTKDIPSAKSKLDVLVLHGYQEFSQRDFIFGSFNSTGNQNANVGVSSSPYFQQQNRLESYLGRINYSYNNKYLITASYRRDASSKFSPENRVSYFPAIAVAWKLKEDFLNNVTAINVLKLRASWGETGNQDGIGNYDYLPRYNLSTTSANYQLGNTFYQLSRPAKYDATLRWETTETQNIGLDYGLFGNRITGSVDVYLKKTKDLLSNVPLASGANFDVSIVTNVGNLENKGIEASLNFVPVRTNNINWEIGLNGSYNQLKVTNLLKYPDPTFKGVPVNGITGGLSRTIGRHTVGYAPYTFYTHKQVYDGAGNPIQGLYEDINRDGVVNADDLVFDKHPNADFLFGLNTSFSFRNFSLSAAAHGALGNYLYNNFNSNGGALTAVKNDLGYITNTGVNYLNTKFTKPQYESDYYVENASYLRLDNINVGYNFGRITNGRASLRLNASIQNVAIITKYSGSDPENSGNGVDNNIYPRPRIYSFGANIDF